MADQTMLDVLGLPNSLQRCRTAYSMGHREHAQGTLGKAEKGCSDMLRFFSQATGMTAEVEKEFLSKFRQLRERLDALKRLYMDHEHP